MKKISKIEAEEAKEIIKIVKSSNFYNQIIISFCISDISWEEESYYFSNDNWRYERLFLDTYNHYQVNEEKNSSEEELMERLINAPSDATLMIKGKSGSLIRM